MKYKKALALIFISIAFKEGGMSLKSVRLIQRIIGVLLLAGGVYLIFVTQEFFGTILIILALLIIPSVSKRESSEYSTNDSHDGYNERAYDNEDSDGGGISDGSSNSYGGDSD